MSERLIAVERVVRAFEQSDWSEIDVTVGDVRVHLVAGDGPATSPDEHRPPSHVAATKAKSDTAKATAAIPIATDDQHLVTAPSMGIFWAAPEPGAAPFVGVGHTVDAAATVCIVEVMKLMNHVKAGIAGEVTAVYVANGVEVTRGQPLFAVRPRSAVELS